MRTLLESIIVIVPDLQYLRARYYDPNMGRFMQQDTLFGEMERPLTQNLYIYCLNNGVNLRDPSGNSSIADLQAQYDRAQRAGAGQSVLDGIKSAMESKRKADSKPTPKPSTKPPKKPDWGDTSNPYNPVNNPNSAGSILSGADGYWSNGGNNGGGGGYAPTQEDAMRDAEAKRKNKMSFDEAIEMLNKILDKQYPIFKKTGIDEIRNSTGIVNSKSFDYLIAQNILGGIADSRFNNAIKAIVNNRTVIAETSLRMGVPVEYITAVILKEQYTQSAPDFLIVALQGIFNRNGSTGLGAVQVSTAKSAWGNYGGEYFNNNLLKSDYEIQRDLAFDDELSIKTIAAVFYDEAKKNGIKHSGNLNNLSNNEWYTILWQYNKNEEYAVKTSEYIPFTRPLVFGGLE